jgi:Na+/citrate or Na+/malate symporter
VDGGAVGAAVLAADLGALVAGLVGALFDLPVIGGLVGTGVLVVILVQSLPLLVGAIGGGSLSASLALYGRRADFDLPKG